MGISVWQLLIVLGIVLLLFGTKKLRNLGTDLGSAVKGFKSAVKDGSAAPEPAEAEQLERHDDEPSPSGVEAQVSSKESERA